MLLSKSKVCFGPEIEEPGVRRHIDFIGSMDKYSLGGRGSRFIPSMFSPINYC